MTPEERFERIERQLEFLATHQAQSAQLIDQHTKQIGQLVDVVSSLVRIVEEQGRRVDERLDRLAEAQKETNDRLNSLIGVVERYFSNGRK